LVKDQTLGKGTLYTFVKDYLSRTIHPGSQVLETGCGGALYREWVNKQGGIYTGCDVPNLLYQTGNDLDTYCSSNGLPFADNSFDILFNQGAFDYMPDPELTIAEAYRVLRPGGRLTIFTYRKDVLEMINRNCRERKRDWEINHHVFSRKQILDWLNNRGFHAREITSSLDTLQTTGFKRRIMDSLGLYMRLQSMYSIWRVYEAEKPA
jgi:ubiquinone/menaquinone biosynthesis C-methylase UbiE